MITLKIKAKRLSVKQLFDRRFSADKIYKQVKYISFSRIFIHRIMHQLLDTNTYKVRSGFVRARSVRTKEHIKRIHEKIRRNS